MKNLRISALLMVMLLVVFSCSDSVNDNIEKLDTQRAAFILGKSKDKQKEDYSAFSFDKRKSLWLSKLTQVSSSNLPKEHLVLVSFLHSKLIRASSEEMLVNADFEEAVLSLADITPTDEFARMFSELEDYEVTELFNEKSNNNLILALKQDFSTKKSLIEQNNSKQSKKPKCNCNWTCDDSISSITEDCVSGGDCGFLWLFSCKKYQEY